jgi:hypothetical protein
VTLYIEVVPAAENQPEPGKPLILIETVPKAGEDAGEL